MKLGKAKAALVLDHPFFATMLFHLPMVEDESMDTMGTDGSSIFYNPKFVESLTIDEIVFVLAHEVMHVALQHAHRLEYRNREKFNVAADYVINQTLVNDRVGTMPKIALYNPELVRKGNGTAEGVYELLPDKPKGYPQAGQPGGALDQVKPATGDESTIKQKQAEINIAVAQAVNTAKIMGKLPGSLKRFTDELLAPKVDWRAVLREFLTRAKTEFSYARPKRRSLSEDVYLPGLTGENIGKVCIAVDCSGSIDQSTLDVFGSEIAAIIEDTNPEEVHVVYFDSEVQKHEAFPRGEKPVLTTEGGGGTAFSPVFEYLLEKQIDPVACVFLTDLQCSDFGVQPDYPVLWVTTDETHAPFGRVVKMKGVR